MTLFLEPFDLKLSHFCHAFVALSISNYYSRMKMLCWRLYMLLVVASELVYC